MRHQQTTKPPRNTGMVDRFAHVWDQGMKVYSLANGVYQVGKVAAPYLIRAAAAIA